MLSQRTQGPSGLGYVLHNRLTIARQFPDAFRELRAEDYAGAFISGGRAPEYIRYDQNLCHVVREIAEAGKPIACLCHGIEILTAAGCIQGKRVTTVPKCAVDAQQGGATYVDEDVVIDGLLVTGRGYGQNTEVLKAFIEMLNKH